ncbi:MAG: hypothetical protein ACXABY_01575 [Candidatus Thorarchaeota archaeon]|jgi:hypothetical protein
MSNDAQIKKLRSRIETKRKALGPKPKIAYATSALLPLGDKRINFNVLSSVADCVAVASDLVAMEYHTEQANRRLDTDVLVKVGNHSVYEWIEDLKQRVSLLEWEAGKRQLDSMDKKLSELRSEGAKTSDTIADIAALLE